MVENYKRMVDYFFDSQQIILTESHEREVSENSILFLDSCESRASVVNHQIIRFDFNESPKSEHILIATVSYIYDNGVKHGMLFNNDVLDNKMKLGQKCVSVLDKLEINHYYPSIKFAMEFNIIEHTITVTDCYQAINLIRKYGTSYHLLEDVVSDLICHHLKSWKINTKDIELTALIDMFLMAKI